MVLELQRLPGVWRVERMLMGRSEGQRRKYIVGVLRRSRSGAQNLEELRYVGREAGGFQSAEIRRQVRARVSRTGARHVAVHPCGIHANRIAV